MTKNEREVLVELATDMKWLKRSAEDNASQLHEKLDKLDQHFMLLNGQVKTNTIWRKMITGIGGAIALALMGAVLTLAMA